MSRKLVLTTFVTFALICSLSVSFQVKTAEASGTIYIRADGSIDPPTANIATTDNVTYTFTGNNYDEIVVERNNIMIDGAGFNIQSSGIGLNLDGRDNVTIQNTNINGAYGGYGGIRLYESSNNRIIGNNITTNSWYGVYVYQSSNNIFRDNRMADNEANFGVFGSSISHFINDIDASNTVNGKPIYYWLNQHDMPVPLDAGYVALVNCTGITAQNLNLTKNVQAILLADTRNSTLTQNNVARSPEGTEGVLLWNSSSNTISENNITAFGENGVKLYESPNNIIVKNNITHNGYHGVYLYESFNNTITLNHITDTYGFSDSKGILLINSYNNTIHGNFVMNNDEGGIQLIGSSSNTINSNEVKDNGDWSLDYGIELTYCSIWDGCYPPIYSDNNTIIGNNITRNTSGIRLCLSRYNTLIENNVINNTATGIQLETASDNTFRNNTIAGNRYNFGVFTFYDEVRLSTYLEDIDISNTVNGQPIYYLVGQEGVSIDSSDVGYLGLVNCTNIHMRNVALRDNGQGLLLAFTSNSTIENATIIHNRVGIQVIGSHANTITSSSITDNNAGVNIYLSSLNNITRNTLTNGVSIGSLITGWGTHWQSASVPCEDNRMHGNMMDGGISLSNRGVTRTYIIGNSIMNGSLGINLEWGASNNTIYNNNFINNAEQVRVNNDHGNCTNTWDNGYPSGGNYWSDYNGTDSEPDGVGDSWYEIDSDNIDHYPLMGMFSDFKVATEYHVQTICNSSITHFRYNGTAISFNATGEDGTDGFCRICVPKALMNDTFRVFVNGTEILPSPEPLLCSNMTHNYLYFNYTHSTQEVVIIAEFPSLLILPLFMTATMLAVIFYRRKHMLPF